MVNKLEEEISAMQVEFAARMAWLRSNYLPDPLPVAVQDCLEQLQGRYDVLRDMVEELEALTAYRTTQGQETVPDEIVGRLLAGESPVRVWREHRGLTLRSLAGQIRLSPSALSDIETGKSEGRPGVLRRIADILNVSLDELIPFAQGEAAAAETAT